MTEESVSSELGGATFVQPKSWKRYVIISVVLLSAIGFSTKGVLAKLAYRYGVEAIPLLNLRMLAAAPFFAVVLLVTSKKGGRKLTGKEHLSAILNGFLGLYLSAYLDFKGLTYINASLERTILFSYPTMILFLSFFFFGKRPTRVQILAVVISYVGLVLALIGDWKETGPGILPGSLMVFGCALSFALYMIGSAKYVTSIGSLRYTSLVLLWATVMTVVHTLFLYPLAAFQQPVEVYQIVGIMAVVSTVFPSLMLAVGLKNLGATNSAILSSVGPVSTIVLSSSLLGEAITATQLIGAALVIGGVILIASEKERPQIDAK